jgi:hypothetical protein
MCLLLPSSQKIPTNLISRLARGEKVKLTQVEMRRLNQRLYAKTPEVVKAREQANAREQALARKKAIKEMDQVRTRPWFILYQFAAARVRTKRYDPMPLTWRTISSLAEASEWRTAHSARDSRPAREMKAVLSLVVNIMYFW